jgi:hypothetical protein
LILIHKAEVENSVNIAIPFYIIKLLNTMKFFFLSINVVYYYSKLEIMASAKIPDYQLKEYPGGTIVFCCCC